MFSSRRQFEAAFNVWDEMLNGDVYPYPNYFHNITGLNDYDNFYNTNAPEEFGCPAIGVADGHAPPSASPTGISRALCVRERALFFEPPRLGASRHLPGKYTRRRRWRFKVFKRVAAIGGRYYI